LNKIKVYKSICLLALFSLLPLFQNCNELSTLTVDAQPSKDDTLTDDNSPDHSVSPNQPNALGPNFTQDDSGVYFEQKIISGFESGEITAVDEYYIKNKTQVAFESSLINPADVETFEKIEGFYAKDKNHYYYKGEIIFPKPEGHLQIFSGSYSKDADSVYYQSEKIEVLKSDTSDFNGDYAYDNNFVYHKNRRIHEEENLNLRFIGENVFETENVIIIGVNQILKQDGQSYEISKVGEDFVKIRIYNDSDGTLATGQIYRIDFNLRGRLSPTALDYETLRVLEGFPGHYLQNNTVYFKTAATNLDLETMSYVENTKYIKDNTRVYFEGTEVSSKPGVFRRLEESEYFVDGTYLFKDGERIQPSFLMDKTDNLSVKDEDHLELQGGYLISRHTHNITNLLIAADLNNYERIGKTNFYKDENGAYLHVLSMRLITSDVENFEHVFLYFSKDSTQVYFQHVVLEGVAPESFRALDGNNSYYWANGSQIGHFQEKLPEKYTTDGVVKFLKSRKGGTFLVHEQGVVFGSSEMDVTSVEDFRLLGKWYSTDGVDLFYRDQKIGAYDASFNTAGSKVTTSTHTYTGAEKTER